jgi:RNA-directed DNA polymerase
VLDEGRFVTSTAGTPQGGVVSPLLSNIALHGLETHLKQWVEKQNVTDERGNKLSTTKKRAGLACIRYADDFVILHKDQNVAELAKSEVQNWLSCVGLELKEAKTRYTHTDMVFNGQVGFDFLGFNIRRYGVGPNSRNKWGAEYRTYVKPAKQSIKNHLIHVDAVLKSTSKTEVVLSKFNLIIRG